jgi:AcrR family transcriptional regulator
VTGVGRALRGRQETRDRFLDAALEVFARVGYQSATVRDILDACGGGRATFYVYFNSKSDIAACLFERSLPEAQAAYELLARRPDLTREVVRDWLSGALGFWTRHRVMLQALNCAMAEDADVARRHHEYITRAASVLCASWEGPYGAEGRLRAELLIFQWERLCWHWLVQGVPYDRDLVLDVLAGAWRDQLGIIRAGPFGGAPGIRAAAGPEARSES